MPELHDALRDLDRSQDPRPEFAADLEARWLAAIASTGVDAPVDGDADGERHGDTDGPVEVAPAPVTAARPAGPRRRAHLVLAAAALVLAALLAVALVTTGDDTQPTEPPPATTTTVPVTSAGPTVLPSGDTLTHRQSFTDRGLVRGTGPKRITATDDGLWVPLATTGRAALLDPDTLAVRTEVDTGLAEAVDVASVGGAVWFAGDGGVARLDPGDAQPRLQDGLVGGGEWDVATSGDRLWAARIGEPRVQRLDVPSGELVGFDVPEPVSLLAASPQRLWVYAEPAGSVPARLYGLDPTTGAIAVTVDVEAVGLNDAVGNLRADDDGVWLAAGGTGAWILHVGDDGTVSPVVALPGDYADGIALDGDGVWVAVRFGTSAYRVSRDSMSVVDQVAVPDRTADVEVGDGVLYAASYGAGAVDRIRLAG